MMAITIDELRKQARRLENEIDLKLVTFCKACAGKIDPPRIDGDSTKEPLLGDQNKNIEDNAVEIESLLQKLQSINDKMNESVISMSGIEQHAIQRHREILADYTFEFNKTMDNYRTRLDNEEELALHSDKNYAASANSGLNRRMDMYLKENEHIRSSSRLIDDQISIAVETREELMSQRLTMKKLQTRLNDVSSRLPVVNSLLYRINLRRRRDSFIVGLVIFICTILILTSMFY